MEHTPRTEAEKIKLGMIKPKQDKWDRVINLVYLIAPLSLIGAIIYQFLKP